MKKYVTFFTITTVLTLASTILNFRKNEQINDLLLNNIECLAINEEYDTPQKLDSKLRYDNERKNSIFNKKNYVHNKKKIQ